MKKLLFLFLPVFFIVLSFSRSGLVKVTGIVADTTGKPIAQATVAIKNTKQFTLTDVNGAYEISAAENATLLVSAQNFHTQEIKISGRALININLVAANINVEADLKASVSGVKIRSIRPTYDMAQGNTAFYSPSGSAEFETEYNTEGYDNIVENGFLKTSENPLSTFSIDVDAASYSNVRRFIKNGQLPPAGAVRTEEMINYFKYNYPQPKGEDPFAFKTEMAECPWNANHRLLLVGMQGKQIPVENLPASNLVFLIDVSGSMSAFNKLPLVKSSLQLLTAQLREQDKVSIVVYAGAAGLVLAPTPGSEKIKIADAINNLSAGGSTAGGEGIQLAYKIANQQFLKEGNNRVILCTDGDFNVGMSSDDDMVRLIEKERGTGIFLTVLGYGMGNYKDNKMQQLADKGNGNHAYIDGPEEAKKVLVNEFGGTLFTIAKDVKLQLEFNPELVQGYRLIGYENRMLKKEDFNDDKKDAGELGSGHTVTALYEIIPAGETSPYLKNVDKLKYLGTPSVFSKTIFTHELLTLKFRYKTPQGNMSKMLEYPVMDNHTAFENSSADFRFAAAVSEFGMLLRHSEYKSAGGYDHMIAVAKNALGPDKDGYRKEFVNLAEAAARLSKGLAKE
ncbi:MAG: von Willebrand factor type A domain-containing protein [Ferruginibacter sp.]